MFLNGQPATSRQPAEWRGFYGNEFWIIKDDGAVCPLLSGSYRTNSVDYQIVQARFDYSDNTFRSVAINRESKIPIEIRYLQNENEVIKAIVGGNDVVFKKSP